MTDKNLKEICCDSSDKKVACCRIESVVTVDDRGQMVLPKEIREKAGIKAGDKLAVVSMDKGAEVCCISLIKVDEIAEMLKSFLGPVMKDVLGLKGE
jgi:AbrB family looped-hinge helix DNA binding protein